MNTVEAVAPWCSIDTSSGSITVTLDPFNCFDAEVYADELGLENAADFREDQRSESPLGLVTSKPANCAQSTSESGYYGIYSRG